jgi:hypothetical protein
MTDPLTFSSVDSNRAKAGVLRSKPAEREATEVALGSYIQLSDMIKQNMRCVMLELGTYGTREACCHHCERS